MISDRNDDPGAASIIPYAPFLSQPDPATPPAAAAVNCGDGVVQPGEDCDPGAATSDCCSAACRFEPAGAACDDRNACTESDSCDGLGVCVGRPVTCQPLDQCHDAGTCNPATGNCSNPPKMNGTACRDGT